MDNQIALGQPSPFRIKIEQLINQRPVILQLLRFVAIGILNTSLDFIIFNLLSKSMHIDAGTRLGYINVVGFACATIQSYIWNRYWAFSGATGGIYKNFVRLVLVGGLGAAAFAAVIIGSSLEAMPFFYGIILLGLIIAEIILWKTFKLASEGGQVDQTHTGTSQFITFVVVSIIGLLINSGLVVVLSTALVNVAGLPTDLVKNVAKALATGVSLIWNFLGYKLIVFKK